ncbi:VanZ family protein [Pelagicoccus albus]
MLTLLISSHFSGPPAGPDIEGFDKIAHFFVFGLLGTLFFRPLRFALKDHRRWIFAFLGVFSYSLCDEFLQYFNPERSFDPYDWMADWSGALLAIGLYRQLAWYRWLLELRLWGRRSSGEREGH